MKKVQILTDSCSDLSTELRAKYGIDYVKMGTVYEGKETPASLDWEYYTPSELYNIMREGNRVTTTQVSVPEYLNAFTKYAKEGTDVLYIGCASPLSGSVNTSLVVKKQVQEEYPECKIICIDAVNSSMAEGLLAIRAANLANEGKTVEEIAAVIEEEKYYVHQFATVGSLDCLKRAGRVKGSAAFFGNLFGVKPIIISDELGNNVAFKKVKGRDGSMHEIVNLMKEQIVDPENQTIYLGHADNLPDAEKLAGYVKEAIPCKEIYTYVIGPIIGASTGPDTLVLYASGKKITELTSQMPKA